MKNIELIKTLKSQSTWTIFFLSMITYGVYAAYYIKEQTITINSVLDESNKISEGFINAILIVNWISLGLMIFYLSSDVYELPILDLVDLASLIMFTVWAFMARNRINTYCSLSDNDSNWFHGVWTFLFQYLYVNYKINTILERGVVVMESADKENNGNSANTEYTKTANCQGCGASVKVGHKCEYCGRIA
jgi:uncharacterized membrane protein